MNEKILSINGIDICTESFGDPTQPAVLLIMGAMASMVWWDDEFCQQLADSGRFVIRFDNRDVGRSHVYDPGTVTYTVEDMADDAVGVLDAYNLDRAHIVGMSLGGMIAQIIAVKHPQRVLSMTLMMSSLYGSGTRELPPIDEKILAYHANGATLDWTDEKAVIHYMAEGWGLLSGSKHPFDEPRAYRLATQEVKRANNLVSMFNHALLKGDAAFDEKLKHIQAPVLIIHGTEDPVLPYGHGLALADEIPHAVLLTLEGVGHEIHVAEWDRIIHTILEHTTR
ncbi:alpha/beta fold hydrolase [Brevibacillus ginsengisoli]|uniref:alpha/beta fold hydrolase n=1 Tax=Brevibacillus ginsengisoli TaxID=363854 RepID=UPI003CF65B92